MPRIAQDVLNKLSTVVGQVWQTVSTTVSEAAGFAVNFSNPLVLATTGADIQAEVNSPRFVITFSFASQPENGMMVFLSPDTVADLYASLKGEMPQTVDEGLVADVRPVLEAIVQGICLGVGSARNEPMVASGLTVRYQIPTLTTSMQKSEELVRCNVPVSYEEFSGTVVWLLDSEVGYHVAGVEPGDERSPFASVSGSGSANGADAPMFDESGLEIIMDIPLDVSVELGRVKLQVREVLELGAGSIVEIDKAAGEPVDVLVNGRLVARGEVVVIDDNFGVRITEILSVHERLMKLNEAA
ncbi:MAG: flagellar motor switch protein FliN [Armatimonadetes bacterium]|nr:flagellar motor switch protein FliN [Armatimonadota bacterium]